MDSAGQRRSAPLPLLPRSISDISDTHQHFGSGGSGSGGFLADSRSASDGAAHASADLLLPEDSAAGSEVRGGCSLFAIEYAPKVGNAILVVME